MKNLLILLTLMGCTSLLYSMQDQPGKPDTVFEIDGLSAKTPSESEYERSGIMYKTETGQWDTLPIFKKENVVVEEVSFDKDKSRSHSTSQYIKKRLDVMGVSDQPADCYTLVREDYITYPYGESESRIKRNGVMKTYRDNKGDNISLLKADNNNYIWYTPATKNNPITGLSEIVPGYPEKFGIKTIKSFKQTIGKYIIQYSDGRIQLINPEGFVYDIIVTVDSRDDHDSNLYAMWSKEYKKPDKDIFNAFSKETSSYLSSRTEYHNMKQKKENLEREIQMIQQKIDQQTEELQKLENPPFSTNENKKKENKKEKKKGKGFLDKVNDFNQKLNNWSAQQNKSRSNRSNLQKSATQTDINTYNRPTDKKIKENRLTELINKYKRTLDKKNHELNTLNREIDKEEKNPRFEFNTETYGRMLFYPEKGFSVKRCGKDVVYNFSSVGLMQNLYVEPDNYLTLAPEDWITSITQEGNIITIKLNEDDYIKYTTYSHRPFDGIISRKNGYFRYETTKDESKTHTEYIFGKPYTVDFYSENTGNQKLDKCTISENSVLVFDTRDSKMDVILSQTDPTNLILSWAAHGFVYNTNRVHTHTIDGWKIYWYKGEEYERHQSEIFQAKVNDIIASYKAKYGATTIDNIMKGNITVGMPWSLVSSVFPNGLFDASSYSQTYKVVNNIPQVLVDSKKIVKQEYGLGVLVYVTVRNGKVSNVMYTNHR